MWYLVLMAIGNYPAPYGAMTIIPEKYPTQQACKDAGNGWLPNKFECIKAPQPEYVDAMPLQSFPKSLICTADGKNCKPQY